MSLEPGIIRYTKGPQPNAVDWIIGFTINKEGATSTRNSTWIALQKAAFEAKGGRFGWTEALEKIKAASIASYESRGERFSEYQFDADVAYAIGSVSDKSEQECYDAWQSPEFKKAYADFDSSSWVDDKDDETSSDETTEGETSRKANRRFKVQYLSEIEPKPIEWLWEPVFPFGAVCIFEGDPGVGKSTVTLIWAAIMSNGGKWPQTYIGTRLLDQNQHKPAGVVLVGIEDDLARTVVPRLIAAGADRTRIATMKRDTDYKGNPKPFVIPDDIDELEYLIKGVNAKVVVIDPITAFLSTKMAKAGDDPSTRQALMPLVELAKETDCAIILVRHWNKATGMSAKHRGSGTIAYGGLARSVLAAAELIQEHENGATHALAVAKSNLAPMPQALGYRLEPSNYDPDIPVVKWCGPIDMTADQLVGANGAKVGDARKNAPLRDQAEEMLRELLADGPQPVADVSETVQENVPCGQKTVLTAAKKMGLVKNQVRVDGKIDHWTWNLPKKTVKLSEYEQQRNESESTNGQAEAERKREQALQDLREIDVEEAKLDAQILDDPDP